MKTRKNTVKKSKILFVVNTLGRAGAETALLELLRHLDSPEYEISLYVIMGQGVMINELPSHVRLMNTRFSNQSVLTKKGKRIMMRTVCTSFLRNGGWFRKLRFIMKNYTSMSRTGHVQPDKLLWRMISDGSPHFSERFDMAVAYLEGASAYYVAACPAWTGGRPSGGGGRPSASRGSVPIWAATDGLRMRSGPGNGRRKRAAFRIRTRGCGF